MDLIVRQKFTQGPQDGRLLKAQFLYESRAGNGYFEFTRAYLSHPGKSSSQFAGRFSPSSLKAGGCLGSRKPSPGHQLGQYIAYFLRAL
jgi:hypothetical protein